MKASHQRDKDVAYTACQSDIRPTLFPDLIAWYPFSPGRWWGGGPPAQGGGPEPGGGPWGPAQGGGGPGPGGRIQGGGVPGGGPYRGATGRQ
eukprot:scaffold530783_cov47-Prasinocladus_malaysianus.AAC.1